MDNMTKKDIIKYIIITLTAIASALAAIFGITACNVTRTITTAASSYNKGDTTYVVQTKTIENYTATKQ